MANRDARVAEIKRGIGMTETAKARLWMQKAEKGSHGSLRRPFGLVGGFRDRAADKESRIGGRAGRSSRYSELRL